MWRNSSSRLTSSTRSAKSRCSRRRHKLGVDIRPSSVRGRAPIYRPAPSRRLRGAPHWSVANDLDARPNRARIMPPRPPRSRWLGQPGRRGPLLTVRASFSELVLVLSAHPCERLPIRFSTSLLTPGGSKRNDGSNKCLFWSAPNRRSNIGLAAASYFVISSISYRRQICRERLLTRAASFSELSLALEVSAREGALAAVLDAPGLPIDLDRSRGWRQPVAPGCYGCGSWAPATDR